MSLSHIVHLWLCPGWSVQPRKDLPTVGLVLLSFFLVFSSASGQGSLLYQKDGTAAGIQFGQSVAVAGDIDGDGKADFIVGASLASPGGLSHAGSAFIYSGATGALLYQKNGLNSNDFLGWWVAGAGDVNGDGAADFILGAPFADSGGAIDAGSAFVYSGATGALLYQKNGAVSSDILGSSVAGAGDLNGDGKADFMVGASLASPAGIPYAGSVFVYSGATGTLLYQKNGPDSNSFLGSSVAGIGDANADGRGDFIIGAPGAGTGKGSVFVYSGSNGALLYQKNGVVGSDGISLGDQLGSAVAGAGDVNGDGRADFMGGAPGADTGKGSVFVYSGSDGVLLYQKNGDVASDGINLGDQLGFAVTRTEDVNGDGRADFMSGSPGADGGGLTDAGSAYVYSGATGALLFQTNGGAAGDLLGYSAAGGGDLDGNGRPDLVIGVPNADPGGLTDAGSALVYCSGPLRGDVNNDAVTDILDLVALVQDVVFEIPLPNPLAGDANCDGVRDIQDLVLLVLYVVFGSPTPCCL